MADKNKSLYGEFIKGIIRENPVLVMLLGMCPTLAVTTQAVNGLGMGAATTFVLLGSNIVVSLLRNIIPDKVGILLRAFGSSLYDSLGIYLTLITVNCIIFGRAEMFASKNKVLPSILDALGMGTGFTAALFIMGSIREIIGSGKWFGMEIPWLDSNPMLIFIMPAGGFFTLGIIIAAVNKIANRKPPEELGCGNSCENCPHSTDCHDKEVCK